MSDPIKPPDGASPPDPAADGPEAVTEGTPGEFRAAVDAAGAARTDALADSLGAGQIAPEQAVEQLVARALSTAEGLSAPQRAQLEAQLRAALADDPTLAALQEDLTRAAKV